MNTQFQASHMGQGHLGFQNYMLQRSQPQQPHIQPQISQQQQQQPPPLPQQQPPQQQPQQSQQAQHPELFQQRQQRDNFSEIAERYIKFGGAEAPRDSNFCELYEDLLINGKVDDERYIKFRDDVRLKKRMFYKRPNISKHLANLDGRKPGQAERARKLRSEISCYRLKELRFIKIRTRSGPQKNLAQSSNMQQQQQQQQQPQQQSQQQPQQQQQQQAMIFKQAANLQSMQNKQQQQQMMMQAQTQSQPQKIVMVPAPKQQFMIQPKQFVPNQIKTQHMQQPPQPPAYNAYKPSMNQMNMKIQMNQNAIMDNSINPPPNPIESYSLNRKQEFHGPYMHNMKAQQQMMFNPKNQQIPAQIKAQKTKIQMPMQQQQQQQLQGFPLAAPGQPFQNRAQPPPQMQHLPRNPMVSKPTQPQIITIQQFPPYAQNIAQIAKKN